MTTFEVAILALLGTLVLVILFKKTTYTVENYSDADELKSISNLFGFNCKAMDTEADNIREGIYDIIKQRDNLDIKYRSVCDMLETIVYLECDGDDPTKMSPMQSLLFIQDRLSGSKE